LNFQFEFLQGAFLYRQTLPKSVDDSLKDGEFWSITMYTRLHRAEISCCKSRFSMQPKWFDARAEG